MRSSFYEYYDLTKEEKDNLWDKALLVLDTNVLLSLYRLQRDARKDILAAITKYKDRLWMPYQVGWEFHEHRLEEACKPMENLRKLKDRVNDFIGGIEKDYGKHPYLKDFKSLKRTLTILNDKVAKQVDGSLTECPNFLHDDVILTEVSDLYDGKVGKPYSDGRLTEIYRIGESRYENRIPPGYKDKEKKTGDRHRFGDLIIWQQMLDKAKESDCDILFVTDDKKEDWWQMHNGDKLGPRRELIAEFRTFTGNHIIGFYTPDRFLSIANERKVVTVKKTTIDEMKYSDLSKIGMESLFGESFLPGQFSTGSLYVDSKSRLGESESGKIALSTLMDDDSSLSTRIMGPHFGETSPILFGQFSSKPFELNGVPLGGESSKGNNSPIDEHGMNNSHPLGDGEDNNDSNNKESE